MNLFGLFKSKKPKPPAETKDAMAAVLLMTFPGGETQIAEETNLLHSYLRGKLPRPDARQLLCRTKTLIAIAKDKSESNIAASIEKYTEGKLTPRECRLVYHFLTSGLQVMHNYFDGSTREKAVVIKATSSALGIDAEYQWLSNRLGKQGHDWTIEARMHGNSEGRSFETFVLKLRGGSSRTVHFDISSFYGRF